MKRLVLIASCLAVLAAVVGCGTKHTSTIDLPSAGASDTDSDSPSTRLAPANEPLAGYTLISPLRSTETYLLNMNQEVVHSWSSDYPPAGTAYLMENGDLLRGARDPEFSEFQGGGIGGILERYNWDGELIWQFRYATNEYCLHHDIAPLPNGNILAIAWERRSEEEAIEQGRDPELLRDDLWPDKVVEIQPEGTDGGKVVWEWRMWDHLIQDFDREKPNYGVIYEHPELIDLNNTGSTPPATPEELRKLRAVGYAGGGDDDDDNRRGGADWLHTNAIDYNAELDQIALSAKNFSEIWIIDHSTTTEEAASHRGGNRGKGGDLLYRWGNPWSYKSGTINDKVLFDQHDVRWIPSGFPGAQNITAFNNGPGREYSSIVEIHPPMDEDGQYVLNEDGVFGPEEPVWEYTAENKEDFYSSFISGATRLANGNTLICEGATGRFFEVNSEGKVLWEHVNRFGGELKRDGRPNDVEEEARRVMDQSNRSFVENNALFRVTKYVPEYSGLEGKTLEPLPEQPVPFASLVAAAVERLKAEEAASADQEATDNVAAAVDSTDAQTDGSGTDDDSSDAAGNDASESTDDVSAAEETAAATK